MFLKTRDGIRCDLCGAEFRSRFHYFSLSAKKVIVDVDAKSTTSVDDDIDVDACEKCFMVIKNRVKETIAKIGGG